MRLQLIRYESVELTEQLMREKENREEDSQGRDGGQEQGTVPAEMELRGVLLEEQGPEEQSVPNQSMIYVLSGEGSGILLQLQETNQEQGVQV